MQWGLKLKRGRPKTRWLDVLADDIRGNGLTIKDAQDRAKWTEKAPGPRKEAAGITLR